MTQDTILLLSAAIALLPLLGFAFLILFGKRLGRASGFIGTAILGTSLLLSILVAFSKISNFADIQLIQAKFNWIDLGNNFFIRVGIGVDNIAAIMLIVVTLISFLVHLFSLEYMADDKKFTRYYAYLGLFSFSMLGIVLANNFLFMFVFWELVGISSYLLIGFWYEKDSAANAGKKAFLVNRIGDLGFLIGIMIMFFTYGTFMYDEIFSDISSGILPFDSGSMLTAAGILIFCGAIGKSAQFPLHVWLPDAMEGPTPVSALIHAATMVAAGVYLVARVFPMLTANALLTIAYFGAITAFIAATIAITQVDFKRVLAYSTVSQLGYMVMGLGVGAFSSGFMHLVTHAWFKAALFLASGSVIHAMHLSMSKLNDHHSDPQNINNMGGLRKKMPITYITFLIATIAIAGVPLTSGFLSKDGILAGTLAYANLTGNWLIPLMGFAAAGMTAFYMFRLTIIAFHGEPKTEIASNTKETNKYILIPLIVLATLSIWFFYSPNPIDASSGWFHNAVPQPHTSVSETYQWDFLIHNEATNEAGALAHTSSHYGTAFEEEIHSQHYIAMALSLLIAGLGIFFAFCVYQFKILNADNLANQFRKLYKGSYNKWYFDEIYQATFINGSVGLAKVLAFFDNKIIDGIVNLSSLITRGFSYFIGHFDNIVIDGFVNLIASITGFFGAALRKVQTGSVQTYIVLAIIGMFLLFYVII